MIDLDLQVFFDVDGFAQQVVRQRAGEADLAFNAIVGTAEVEALQGNVMAAQNGLLFAATDVLEGDIMLLGATPYRVLAVDPRNDGAEMLAYLSDIV